MVLTNKRAGFTLIELLLYVAVIGVLLAAVTAFFGVAADARIKNQTISEVNDQGTFALSTIALAVHNATSISSPAAGGSASSLSLVVPTASLSPTVFSLASGVLQMQEGANTAVALTSNDVQVTAFTVKNLTRSGTADIVQISFTLARVNSAGRNEYDYTRTFTTSAEVWP